MSRRGLSLVDVLMALLLLGVVGGAMAATMHQTVRGAGADRGAEMQRKLALDLCERLGHASSDLPALWPAGAASPRTRVLTVAEALRLAAVPPSESANMERILVVTGVTGVELAWERLAPPAKRDPLALSLDRLRVRMACTGAGPLVTAYRVFALRGAR